MQPANGTEIRSTARVRRVENGILFTPLDDELLGLDTRNGLAYGLNPPAARVWELIDGWTSVDTVCARLQDDYEVDRVTCETQVVELLGRLRGAGLVEVAREGERDG